MEVDYDICVIGGGINGTGIARDAQGRGYRTLLAEAQDLAAATSSASTKLIHGGLRYLEQYQFGLVRESLRERANLMSIAPHLVRPMDFVLPHDDNLRPHWMVRTGLRLYDFLAGRQALPKSAAIEFSTHPYGDPLADRYERGFTYADCAGDDARLVVLNALDAKERGAEVLTRTAVTRIEPRRGRTGWEVTLYDIRSGNEFLITAGAVVNAGGPWVRPILEASDLTAARTPLARLVKGSHIVVPQLYDGAQSYIVQQPDGRIVFAIPYQDRFTLIGTTDIPYADDPAAVHIAQEEIDYLLAAANHSFKARIGAEHIVWTYSGVRALADDGEVNASKITRDYKLDLHVVNKAPILSVFGGKLTTYRRLAETAVNKITRRKASWTSSMPLPGGNIRTGMEAYISGQAARYAFLPPELVARYACAYGTRMDKFMEGKHALSDMGHDFGGGVYQVEIDYLTAHEFAATAEDIFWRRSKLGLHVHPDTIRAVDDYLTQVEQG